jgi:hypothetical protein
MQNDATTRWTVSMSRKTDIAVRTFLVARGMKKGDLSKFIEDAVDGAYSIRPWRRRATSSRMSRRTHLTY